MQVLQSLSGIAVLLFVAWLMSENRGRVSARLILSGIGLQLVVAVLLLKLSFFQAVFVFLNRVVTTLENSTLAGATALFGYLSGGATPFEITNPAANYMLAFRGLPLVLFMSALSALLFYWRVLPVVVRGFCGRCAGLWASGAPRVWGLRRTYSSEWWKPRC